MTVPFCFGVSSSSFSLLSSCLSLSLSLYRSVSLSHSSRRLSLLTPSVCLEKQSLFKCALICNVSLCPLLYMLLAIVISNQDCFNLKTTCAVAVLVCVKLLKSIRAMLRFGSYIVLKGQGSCNCNESQTPRAWHCICNPRTM